MLPGEFGRKGAVAAMQNGSLKVYPLEKCAEEIQSIVLECGKVSTGQRRGGPNGYALNTKQVQEAWFRNIEQMGLGLPRSILIMPENKYCGQVWMSGVRV